MPSGEKRNCFQINENGEIPMRMKYASVIGLVFLSAGSRAFADVKLPALFSDNMVIQKSEKTAFFGTADNGEKVTVKVGDVSADATAGQDGKWKLFLDTRNLSGPLEVSVSGKNSIQIKNAIVGEVWVASGQSNMEWVVANTKDSDLEIPAANDSELRMFTVTK